MTDQPMFRDPLGTSFGRTLDVQNGIAQMAEILSQPIYSAKALATRNQEMTKLLEERARAAAEAREAHSAAGWVRRLKTEVRLFEADLDAEHDVGMRLASFGDVTFHVTDVGSVEPDLITFSGKTEAGALVRLLLHRHQAGYLLMRLKRADPDQPKRPVGFHHQ